jgi:hypothetical protein
MGLEGRLDDSHDRLQSPVSRHLRNAAGARGSDGGDGVEHEMLLDSARGPLPSVAEMVAGEPIRGSWWGHPGGHASFDALNTLAEPPNVVRTKLVNGKVTLVHRRLWPALARVADRFSPKARGGDPPGAHQHRRTSSPRATHARLGSQRRAAGRPGSLSPRTHSPNSLSAFGTPKCGAVGVEKSAPDRQDWPPALCVVSGAVTSGQVALDHVCRHGGAVRVVDTGADRPPPIGERGCRQDTAQRGSQPMVAACTTDGPGPSPSPSTCAVVSGWSNPWETTTWERPALMATTVVPTPAWWRAARLRA